MCNPEEHKNGKCDSKKTPCCYYCRFIVKCYKDWLKNIHYCRIDKSGAWCSGVKRHIDIHGLEVWSVS